MKKIKLYCIIALFGCICAPAQARVGNWVGLSIEAGEWSLLPSKESMLKPSLGGGGALSFNYELNAGHFLFQTGLGATGGYTSFNVPECTQTLYNQKSAQGQTFDFIYRFNDRHDAYATVNAQIPLLLGGNWNRFYFLAGAKLGMNCTTWTMQQATMNTEGDFHVLMHNVTGMPEQQFYDDLPISGLGATAFNFNVDASAEIGLRLGYIQSAYGFDVPKSHVQYRLALFADYGLMDCHRPQKNEFLVVPGSYNREDMVSNVRMNDILSVRDIAHSVNNLLVGIKFTLLFEVVPTPKCVTCEKDAPLRSRKGGTKIEL